MYLSPFFTSDNWVGSRSLQLIPEDEPYRQYPAEYQRQYWNPPASANPASFGTSPFSQYGFCAVCHGSLDGRWVNIASALDNRPLPTDQLQGLAIANATSQYLSPYAEGGVKIVGGVASAAACFVLAPVSGGATLATAWFALDDVVTGVRTIVNHESTRGLTNQGIYNDAVLLGASDGRANSIAGWGDFGLRLGTAGYGAYKSWSVTRVSVPRTAGEAEAGLIGALEDAEGGASAFDRLAARDAAWEADNPIAQVTKNRIAGNAFRDELAAALRAAGRDVDTEVYKSTPFGRRFIDLEVSQNGSLLGGIETKVGSSRYYPLQRLKDAWLWRVEGYPVTVVRKP